MPHMYILECADGSLYVGSTIDLERRLTEHQSGEGAAYTRRRRPVRLLYAEEYSRVDEAFAREKQVQNWGRIKRIALIEGRIDDLRAASVGPRAKRSGEAALRAAGAAGARDGGGLDSVAPPSRPARPPMPQ